MAPVKLSTVAMWRCGRPLEARFTTLRDLGTEGAGFADVALGDAVGQGIVPQVADGGNRSRARELTATTAGRAR